MKSIFVLCICTVLFSCKAKQTLPDPLEAGWNGVKVCEVEHETEKIRVLKCTFPPNVGHEKHFHNPHYGYTVKGSKFRIKDDKGVRELNVKTGTKFSKDIVTEHEVLNVGDSTAVFLIIEHK